jgi:metallo-beta-lactamase class B
MCTFRRLIRLFAISFFLLHCSPPEQATFEPEEVYKAEDLIITRIAENSYVHTSFKQTNDFGYVPCNGLIVCSNKEAVVFDTPTTDSVSKALVHWIKDSLGCKINAIIPTHFHDDCLGGLKAFHEMEIPSHGFSKTIALATENNYEVPKNSFDDALDLNMGNQNVVVRYFGEGHTKDNVVGYFPADGVLFGGCMIKELDASKGYLGDANIAAWPGTVEKVKKGFPQVKLVVPGHGAYGDKGLLDYTIGLFGGK